MSYTPATDTLIHALQALPGVGSRSAQRMALHLLERDNSAAQALSQALQAALSRVHKCPTCRSLTETDLCSVCADSSRDQTVVCVVVSDADKAGLEMAQRFRGRYFVLHGVLSPIDGVGPEQLGLFDLLALVQAQGVGEVILALDEQMESEATAHYISEQLRPLAVKRSRIRFAQMRSGSLDKVDSHVIANAIADKKEIGLEFD
ncbi:MAG: recombination protein RecR [Reinekea sp.]|jgi:recombination protein RecR